MEQVINNYHLNHHFDKTTMNQTNINGLDKARMTQDTMVIMGQCNLLWKTNLRLLALLDTLGIEAVDLGLLSMMNEDTTHLLLRLI